MRRSLPRLRSVYYEVDAKQGIEHKIVELFISQDVIRDKLLNDITKARAERRDIDNAMLTNIFYLSNQFRDSFMELINCISIWQKSFTKIRRPRIKETDFLLNIIESMEFLCSSKVNKMFKFQIERGNILFLPLPIGTNHGTYNVTQELKLQIEKFMNPDISRIVKTYQTLVQCLPTSIASKLMPIEKWGGNPWRANLHVITGLMPIIVNAKDNEQSVTESMDKMSRISSSRCILYI